MAQPITIKIGLDIGDVRGAGQQIAQQLQSGLAGQIPSAKQIGDQFTSALTPSKGLIQRALEALRLIPKEAQRVSKDTESAFSSGLSGGVFSRLVAQARSAFSSIRSAASSILGGGGGGGGNGGGGLLDSILGVAGGNLLSSTILGGIGALGGALKSVVTTGVDFNATIESAGISLKHLLGSANAAKEEIAKLKKEASVAPVNFETLLELDQRLIAVGFSAQTTAKDLTAFSQGLGLIAGTKGLDDRLGRVVTQLTQMATKGKAANEELVILAENNIPVYKILADATGKTADEINRLAETGQLDGLKTAQLIFKEIGKSAADAAPEIQKSFAVLSSNLGDLFQQTSGQATENIFGSLKKGLEALTSDGASGLANTIATGVNNITKPLTDGFNKAVESLQSGTFFTIGSQIVQGLGDGIKQTAQGAWDKAKELGQGVLDTVKGILQIQSPSKAMEELGQFAGDGFITGLIDRTSEGFRRWAKQIEEIGGDEFLKAVEKVARKVGANPNDLLGVFGFESGLNPGRVNAQSKATGLIQFLPSTAKSLGTTTGELANQKAVDQLEFVEKYLAQFGKVLDTTEKLYSAVLRGRVLNDPQTVLFSEGTKAFKQNRGLDKDASGTITLNEAADQIRKQGFTTPSGPMLRDAVPIVTEVRAQTDKIAVNTQAIATAADLVAPPFLQTSEAARTLAQSTTQADAGIKSAASATATLTDQTSKAADQAAVFASIWKNPLTQQIRDVKNEIAQIGENMSSKEELAQLQAIRDIKKADEDAVLSQVRSRTILADATIYHAQRANAAVLDFLAKETRGVTEIVTDARVGVIKTLFDTLDRGIGRLTAKFGIFKDVFAQVISGVARLFLSPIFAALNGGGGGAPAGGFGGFGGFATGGFAGGGGAASILGGGGGGGGLGSILGGLGNLFGGGLSAPSSLSLPSIVRPTVFNPGFGTTPFGKAGGGLFGSILGGLGGLFKGIGFGKSAGSGGALAGALPLLGLSLGAGLGGPSGLGQILGGAGGALLGIGLTAAPAGLAGGALGFLAPLFSNPITAIVGGALLPLAFLLGRSKQRAKDEATSGDFLTQAIDGIRQLRTQAEAGQITASQARQIFESQILGQFIQQINTLKTKSVRESRLKNQVADLRALFEKEVIPAANAAKARGAISDKLVPEFATGGIVPGIDRGFDSVRALVRPGEMVLTRQQQSAIQSVAGSGIFQAVGVPGAGQQQGDAQAFAFGGVARSAGPMEIMLDVQIGLSEDDARQIIVRGAKTSDGQDVIVRTVRQARRNGEV